MENARKMGLSKSGAHWKIELPRDFSPLLPPDAKTWLYNAGITDFDIYKFGFGYSHKHSSVVLPLYEAGELIYYQMRYLGDDKEHWKYHNVAQRGRKDIFFRVAEAGTHSVVLVEDILSCIRVGEVCNTIAILSAHVPESLIKDLDLKYDNTVLWLDSDKWDYMGKLLLLYRQRGFRVLTVLSHKDPKKYTEKEIRKFLGEVIDI